MLIQVTHRSYLVDCASFDVGDAERERERAGWCGVIAARLPFLPAFVISSKLYTK